MSNNRSKPSKSPGGCCFTYSWGSTRGRGGLLRVPADCVPASTKNCQAHFLACHGLLPRSLLTFKTIYRILLQTQYSLWTIRPFTSGSLVVSKVQRTDRTPGSWPLRGDIMLDVVSYTTGAKGAVCFNGPLLKLDASLSLWQARFEATADQTRRQTLGHSAPNALAFPSVDAYYLIEAKYFRHFRLLGQKHRKRRTHPI